jgi:hypothetical protein
VRVGWGARRAGSARMERVMFWKSCSMEVASFNWGTTRGGGTDVNKVYSGSISTVRARLVSKIWVWSVASMDEKPRDWGIFQSEPVRMLPRTSIAAK